MTSFYWAFCWTLAAIGADPQPLGGDYGPPRLLVPAPTAPKIAHLSWPKIVATPNGNLVLAYSAGVGHNIGGSGPAVSISTDRAATFSSPHLLAYFPDDDARYRDCGNLALGVAGDGAVVLLAMAYAGDQQNTILGWRSTDDGQTWHRIDTWALADNKTGSVYGHIQDVPELGLVVFGHYRRPSQPNAGVWMAKSDDHGQSWGPPQVVTTNAYFEPAFTFTQGRWIGLLRLANDADTRRYDQAVSDDLGQRWQIEPSRLAIPDGLPGRQPSPFITVDPANPNRLYAIQSIRGDHNGTRGRAYLWTAEGPCLDWERQGRLAAIPKNAAHLSDWSYPWMTPIGDDRWVLVFYAGTSRGSSSLYGLVFTP